MLAGKHHSGAVQANIAYHAPRMPFSALSKCAQWLAVIMTTTICKRNDAQPEAVRNSDNRLRHGAYESGRSGIADYVKATRSGPLRRGRRASHGRRRFAPGTVRFSAGRDGPPRSGAIFVVEQIGKIWFVWWQRCRQPQASADHWRSPQSGRTAKRDALRRVPAAMRSDARHVYASTIFHGVPVTISTGPIRCRA